MKIIIKSKLLNCYNKIKASPVRMLLKIIIKLELQNWYYKIKAPRFYKL